MDGEAEHLLGLEFLDELLKQAENAIRTGKDEEGLAILATIRNIIVRHAERIGKLTYLQELAEKARLEELKLDE